MNRKRDLVLGCLCAMAGVLILQERFTAIQAVGAVVIVIGITMANLLAKE